MNRVVFPEENKTLILAYGHTNAYSTEAKTIDRHFMKGSGRKNVIVIVC